MISFLKPYRKAAVIALLLMLVELAVELWHPLLLAHVINEGILKEDVGAIWKWGGIMVLLSLLAFASGVINSFFAAQVSQGFGFDVRKRLYERMQAYSLTAFDRFSTSSLITRVTNDVNQLQNVIFMGLRIMMRAPLLMVGGFIMALMVNVKLALVLVVVTPLLLGFLLFMMNKGFSRFRRVQGQMDRTNGVLRENLMGMRLIKAFVRSRHENERFKSENSQLMERTASALRLIETTIPALLLVMNLSILIILWQGSFQTEANIGEVVAIVNYATRMTGAFSVFSMILSTLARAKASAGRVRQVLEADASAEEQKTGAQSFPMRGRLEFDQVSFTYPDQAAPALADIQLTVEPGQTVAVMGATGAGKSTLFQLIPRLYEPDAGIIRLDGKPLSDWSLESLRKQIGYVPQESLLFTGTVADNIRWGKEEATIDDIIEAAKHAQIHETISKLPLQYDTVVGQKGVNLSGGQKQRLSIARALVRKPRIILLDDSTSALDIQTEQRLLHALKPYDCTILMITQKVSAAQKADRIVLLDDGRVAAQGTHAELMRHSPLYRQIVHSQYGEEATGTDV
ncbi:ABC transporter ATP-binding protein [Xylanibacillus composti]|uniref:Putative ABC transporter ATP-binding protein YfiB n=1 Tax=Xylanibacillus composti TaxID=1572762 RepID=A0A8J4H0S3_9BACL|nr:ABC transporter ATP-binding protein [Xylanibacillus composti]MDT9726033.1 ABC transporter ATP-binding protein [Xylanibacillus composti]GIQ68822.1 putative ABC transporter ATP-binding protein YfiB [Xylanibacillus composti]